MVTKLGSAAHIRQVWPSPRNFAERLHKAHRGTWACINEVVELLDFRNQSLRRLRFNLSREPPQQLIMPLVVFGLPHAISRDSLL